MKINLNRECKRKKRYSKLKISNSFLFLLSFSIKKAARRTYLPSAANGGGGGGLFAGLKPMSGSVFGGLSGSGAGVLGRAPLSSVNQLSAMSSTRKDGNAQ